MPAQYVIDTPARIVRTELKGTVDNHDLAQLVHRLRKDRLFDATFFEIINLEGCSEVQFKARDLLAFSKVDPFLNTSKRAFVVGSRPFTYGVARMFQLARHESPYVSIFHTTADAEAWLGLFEESAPDAIA